VKPSKAVEFAVGRDQLPSGVNLPDLALFIRSRDRLGYYDSPVQAKAFIAAGRARITPYAYAPGGNEAAGDAEHGAGALAEIDVPGTRRVVAGVSLRTGVADAGDRQTVGGYARVGFGRWGLFAEHDLTSRTRDALPASSVDQSASFAQVFWAMREWFVVSATGERLVVDAPYEEHRTGGKMALSARLSRVATLAVSGGVQKNGLTGAYSKTFAVQAAFKTIQ